MNYRIIFHTTGKVLLVEAGLLVLPLLVSVLYHERCAWAVLASMAAAAVIGGLLTLLARPRRHTFFNREGYIIVALAWVLLSAVGALPFWFSREIPSYADAFFETVSGFTTTGASILTDVEAMSHGLLFWRSFTHWVGGMGVLVFITMISGSSDRSMNILKAEMPGPVVGKLTPRTRDTARVLYLLYFLITTVLVGMLLLGGMPLFDSLVHAFGTVGTGGFGIKADSIASYSPYIQGVITVFMILCGINFNLYYLLLLRQWRSVLRSDELWTYLGLVVVATGVITLDLRGVYGGLGTCLRQAAFQVGSVITTTGYATADFNVWPGLSRAILFALMFIGGCAGSTAGGLKVSRAAADHPPGDQSPGPPPAGHCRPLRRQGPGQRGPAGRQHLLCPVLPVYSGGIPVPQRRALHPGNESVGGGVLLQQCGPRPGGGGSRRKLCGLFRPVKVAAVHGHAHGPVGDLSHAGGAVPLRLAQGLRRKNSV